MRKEPRDPKAAARNRKAYWKKRAREELAEVHRRYEGQALVEYWASQIALKDIGEPEACHLVDLVFPHETSSVQQQVAWLLVEKGRASVGGLRKKVERIVQYVALPDRLRPRFPPVF